MRGGENHGPFGKKNFSIPDGYWRHGPRGTDMPEPGTDMAPRRRWRYVPGDLVAVIALQVAGAGAGVAAGLAAGGAGPARAAGGAVAGVAGPQGAGVRWLVLAGGSLLCLN